MLKIKDNVDLKELEKYGFKKHKRDDKDVIVSKWVMERIYGEDSLGMYTNYCSLHSFPIIVITETLGGNKRVDLFLRCGFEQIALDLLYDLIQAGLVEKV